MTEDTVADDVRRAATGDQAAWDRLVQGHAGLVWSVARSFRLDPGDAADVSQTTWLRLVEHLDTLHNPQRLAAWLVTTAKRECLRTLRSRSREVPLDVEGDERADEALPPPEARLLAQERSQLIWAGLRRLSDACQRLLRVLMCSPPPSYEAVGAALGMPIGSIGPTRARCLAQLRRHLGELGITPAGGDSV